MLWLKSHTAEAWLDRRTNFTRSLATMSMIGYILGLGDRHPSNLLLDRITGKVLHIDFGDCFEVGRRHNSPPTADCRSLPRPLQPQLLLLLLATSLPSRPLAHTDAPVSC